MKILFRADASVQEGGGHLIRSLAIAEEFIKHGHNCLFISQRGSFDLLPQRSRIQADLRIQEINQSDYNSIEALEQSLPKEWMPDLTFVDSYRLSLDYQNRLQRVCSKLAILDDMPIRAHMANILIDPTLNRKKEEYTKLVPSDSLILTGVEFAPLRAEFSQLRKSRTKKRSFSSNSPIHIVVSLGLSDPDNATFKILEGLVPLSDNFKISIVIGKNSPFESQIKNLVKTIRQPSEFLRAHSEMATLLASCDFVIGGGGSSSWERCALGVPALQVILADNQIDVTETLVKRGAVRSLGHLNTLKAEHVTENVLLLLRDPNLLRQMSNAASQVCDGLGTARIVESTEKFLFQKPHRI